MQRNNKEKGMRVATRVRAGNERERKWEHKGKSKDKGRAGKDKERKERKENNTKNKHCNGYIL